MPDCNHFDQVRDEYDIENRYIENRIEIGRLLYRQEWQDYLDYIDNDRWGDEYDL